MATKPRNLFEEVGDARKAVAATPGGIDRGTGAGRHWARIWLIVLAVMVAAIVVVGGLTRLTDSGLSITEWAPLSGAMPPMGDAAWSAEFAAYQQSPEYLLQNQGMSLDEFKYIFWWEWSHRQLGRLIGLVWAAGFAALALSRGMPRGWTARLLLVGALIGLQGAVGWWMVSSGLQGSMMDVASYRLATHLGLAFAILAVMIWFIFKLGRREADLLQARRSGDARLFGAATGLMHLTFVQVLLGALVAGIDAGRAFPTWPLMGDGFLPPDPFTLTPVWRNFFEDAGLVQFIHRMTAYLLIVLAIVVWRRGRRQANAATRRSFDLVMLLVLGQATLGIYTALMAAPLYIAILHQIVAVALWVAVLRARFLARYPLPQSIRG